MPEQSKLMAQSTTKTSGFSCKHYRWGPELWINADQDPDLYDSVGGRMVSNTIVGPVDMSAEDLPTLEDVLEFEKTIMKMREAKGQEPKIVVTSAESAHERGTPELEADPSDRFRNAVNKATGLSVQKASTEETPYKSK